MRPLKPNTTRVNTRNVPVPVRDMFKAYCARRGYTMEAAVIALMRKAVKDDLSLLEDMNQK